MASLWQDIGLILSSSEQKKHKIMSIQDEIDSHTAQIKELKRQQDNCAHTFGEPFEYDFVYKLPIVENRPMGSDYFNPTTVGWETLSNEKWKKVCSKCGKALTTSITEPVISGIKPVFI